MLGSIRFRLKAHHKRILHIRLNAYGRNVLSHSRNRNRKLTAYLIVHLTGAPSWVNITRRVTLIEAAKRGHAGR
jgi:hypothetical protein